MTENLRVLIVDDEPGMRLGAERVLQKVKTRLPKLELDIAFTCDLAENGGSAIEKLSSAPYDLLLLDYKLPDITGLEVLEQIKARKIEVVTIMMTAYASLEVAVSATKNGAFDFLAKPFTPEELKNVVLKAAAGLSASRHAGKLSAEKRRVRFEFISVLAHELKSPLSAVESYLQLLKGHALGEQIGDYDAVVDRSMLRLDGMRRLIFDLLDLTRIESGEKSRKTSLVDVVESVGCSIENVMVDAQKRNIAIHTAMPPSLMFWADAGELQMICNNLISNAVKYNRDNGEVRIDAGIDGEVLTLRVADTGIGIDPEDRTRLFSAFSRIRNRDTEHIQGSGLGLSILKKLSALYEGNVDLESEPGRGSTFTVTLLNREPG